ncbi:MAG: 30S ribosomal protein S11 [Elusimicrobia bacterium]|nr:30S ribosomal protein S11 [Elusimicrobiota bacterium]
MADEKAKEPKKVEESKSKETGVPSEGQKSADLKPKAGRPSVAPKSKSKSKSKLVASSGRVYIKSSFNNTIITITDDRGNVIGWGSSGSAGFKGTKKGTPFAAQIASANCARKLAERGLKHVAVFVSGPGSGRETAIRALQISGLTVTSIKDITPIPHNGCRPPKQRRV